MVIVLIEKVLEELLLYIFVIVLKSFFFWGLGFFFNLRVMGFKIGLVLEIE